MKPVAILIAVPTVIAIFIYLVMLGGSHVYVSHGSSLPENFMWGVVYESIVSYEFPGLSTYGAIEVDELNASHALRNVLYIMCMSASILLFPLLFAVFTIKDGTFEFWHVLGIILLSMILMVVSAIGSWILLLLQTSTLAYKLIWILVGVPAMVLGVPSGASPYLLVIVVVKR